MERRLIDYLPMYVQEYTEISAIMESEQDMIEKSWNDTDDIMNNQFVVDATEGGVKRYEKILNIKPKAIYDLNERKFNILVRLNEQLPYTVETLKNVLTSLCGEDGYLLKVDNNKYAVLVKLSLSNEHNLEAVEQLLDKMLPANLIRTVTTFNVHSILAAYTHGQLAAFTHKEIRERSF